MGEKNGNPCIGSNYDSTILDLKIEEYEIDTLAGDHRSPTPGP